MQEYEKKMPGKMKVVIVVIALLMALAVFFANRSVQGPIIQADEGNHVANAAAIAGLPSDMANGHHAGYSILIAPAFWIGDTPGGVWTAIKAINAVLYALIILGLWLVAKHISPTTTFQNRFAAAILISLYPMWVVMAGYSFAQIAFVPVFIFTFLMYLRSIRGGLASWIALGLISGFLYWVHPTGAAPIIAVGISSAYITWHRRNYASFALLLVSMIAMILIYKFGFTPWLHAHMDISGAGPVKHYPGLSRILASLMTFEGIKEILTRIAGQFFYLTIGTVGLLWLGLFTLTGNALRNTIPQESDSLFRDRAIALFSWLSLVGIIVLPTLMWITYADDVTNRLDQWMYGRYVEGVIAPILLIGALSATSRKRLFWTIVIAVLSAAVLTIGSGNYSTDIAVFNISAFWQGLPELGLLERGIWVWLATGCALIVLAAAVPRKIGMIIIALVFLFSSFLQIDWHTIASTVVSHRWRSALSIRDQFPPGTCVGFDHDTIDDYNRHIFWYDFGLILFDYKLQRLPLKEWLNKCDGPIFTYEKNLDKYSDEIYPVTSGGNEGPVAWAKGRPPNDSYPMTVSYALPSPALFNALGPGWNTTQRAHLWSEADSLLKLPVPEECKSGACSVILSFSVNGASETRPVKVAFKTNSEDEDLLPPLVFRDQLSQKVILPLNGSHGVFNLFIRVPDAISPGLLHGSPDTRVLGVALHSIELKTPKTDLKSSYPIVVSKTSPSPALTKALGPGWNDPDQEHVWSGTEALLKLPVPEKCKSGGCSVVLTLSAYGASEGRPVEVFFAADPESTPLPPFVTRDPFPQKIVVPLSGSRAISHLAIKTSDATTPGLLQGTGDTRALGVTLHSIELKTPKTDLKDSYPIIVSKTSPSPALTSALGPGWSDLERAHIWSGAQAQLKLPVPENCKSGTCSVELTLSAYGASETRPVEVIFKTESGDVPKLPPFIARDPFPRKVVIPLSGNHEISNLTIIIPDATSPRVLYGANDTRVLGVALHSVELKTHSTDPKDSYPMIVSDTDPSPALFDTLGPGWKNLEEAHVWSGANALLKLPVPDECRSGTCSVMITLKAYGASKKRPVKVFFKANPEDPPLLPPTIIDSFSSHRVTVPLNGSRTISNLFIEVPDAISPYDLHGIPDKRVLGMGLYSIELKIPETNKNVRSDI